MDRVTRLIAVLLLLFVVPAHAYKTVTRKPTTTYTCTGISGQKASSTSGAAAACSQVVPGKVTSGGATDHYYTETTYYIQDCGTDSNGQFCRYYAHTVYPNCSTCAGPDTWAGSLRVSVATSIACPINSTQIGATENCNCDSGYLASGGNCVQYTCPPSGSYTAITQPDQKVGNAGDSVCTGGCSYAPSSWKVGQDGQIWATWPFKSTGGFCQGAPDATGATTGELNSSNPAPVPCGQNQCPGTVNGATVCVPCKGQQEQGPSTSASAPDGSASSATGTSTKTECNGVSCTTTTTTTDGTGAVTGTQQVTQKQESFCKENPQSSLCKQSSISGSCGGPIACDGDAIQCAIAADQIKRNCQWFDDAGTAPLKSAGDAAMTGQDQPAGHPANSATSQSVSFGSQLDQTDRLGGSCPQDVSFSLMGKAVVMPMSKACEPLQIVGQLAVAVTALACAFIVFK